MTVRITYGAFIEIKQDIYRSDVGNFMASHHHLAKDGTYTGGQQKNNEQVYLHSIHPVEDSSLGQGVVNPNEIEEVRRPNKRLRNIQVFPHDTYR